MAQAPLRSMPKIKAEDRHLLEAYDAISRGRTWGMAAPNPLSLVEISAFCALLGIASPAERAKYLRITQDLDAVFLDHWAQNNKNKA